VTPHSLGIEVAEWAFGALVPDRYQAIIHRNTALPTTRAMAFSALHPDQTRIEVKIYQGEAEVASDNTLLGEFLFEDLLPDRPGLPPSITVEFDLDVNGILQVSATDRGSRRVKQATVHAPHRRLSPADKQAAARFLETVWDDGDMELTRPRSGDDPILARARARLEAGGPGTHTVLADLVRRAAKAQAEGRREALGELLDQLVECLYELEGEVDPGGPQQGHQPGTLA
jgi:molecular chaperone DnaK